MEGCGGVSAPRKSPNWRLFDGVQEHPTLALIALIKDNYRFPRHSAQLERGILRGGLATTTTFNRFWAKWGCRRADRGRENDNVTPSLLLTLDGYPLRRLVYVGYVREFLHLHSNKCAHLALRNTSQYDASQRVNVLTEHRIMQRIGHRAAMKIYYIF
jgi:hypothetical protein